MTTAGGILFGSSNAGYFFALDTDNGEPLWSFITGEHVRTNPIGSAVNSQQRAAIIGRLTLSVFGRE